MFLVYPQIYTKCDEASFERSPVILGQGEQRLLRISGLRKYSIGGSAIKILQLPPTLAQEREALLIRGDSAGSSDLWVWKKDGTSEHRTIYVEKVGKSHKNPPFEKALGKLEEAEIIFTGKGAVLRGKIQTLAECARISAVLQAYPQEIFDETEISENILATAQNQLQSWIKTSSHSSLLRVERAGQTLWIRGSVSRPSEETSLVKKFRSIYPLVQTEMDSMPDHAPTVYFRVFLLELKRSQFHSLGISWPSSAPGAFHVTTGAIQDLLQIDLMIQQLEGKGNARVLSSPELVVRAPGEAELFAGGELPIMTQNRFFSNVMWKNYGLTLKLKVTHTAGDRIRLDIFTEVSHLDIAMSQDKIPGIQANRMKTQVDARFGTPLLLSGLLQEGVRIEAKGLPFLRQIPVLGLLFGSEDYLQERSELVAILYPHAAPPQAPIEKMKGLKPRGPIPLSRNWVSPMDEQILRNSPDYPWNALQ